MNFIDSCRKFIAIESSPGVGNWEIANFAGQLCEEVGLKVELQEENYSGNKQCNLIAHPAGGLSSGAELMLQSHLDTEDPGPYGMWSKTAHNPFNASIYEDRIYGLGAAGGKLDFLCKLTALNRIDPKLLKNCPIVLVGTFGHHQGMVGAKKLIRRKKVQPTMALIGGPTELQVGFAGAGYAAIESSVPFSPEEKRYHSNHDLMESSSTQSKFFRSDVGEPEEEQNAITAMFDYLSKLPKGIALMDIEGGTNHSTKPLTAVLEIDMVDAFTGGIIDKLSKIHRALLSFVADFKQYQDDGFSPSFPTLNLGRIHKEKENVRILGSCKLLPSLSSEVYEKWLEKLGETCREVGATFKVVDYKQPYSLKLDSPFLGYVGEVQTSLGISDSFIKVSSGSEASVFSRLGAECIVYGPGRSHGNWCFPDEYVSLASLEGAIQFYKSMVERVSV